MKTLISLTKKPNKTFKILIYKRVNWANIITLFSFNGIIIIYYLAKLEGLISLENKKTTVISILSIITLGVFYGILSNLLVGYFIKITGKLFKTKNNLIQIYKAISWSNLPFTILIFVLILKLLIEKLIATDISEVTKSFYSILLFTISLIELLCVSFQLILLFLGIKIAQKLTSFKTALNIMVAIIIYSILFLFVIKPYLL
tara:strand:- start:24992 stop:25597 length:606 start_codon:yes stop_codon:yes gene_type:complete